MGKLPPRWVALLVSLSLGLVLVAPWTTQAQSGATVEFLSINLESYPEFTIDFRVRDGANRDILGVAEPDVEVIEDGAPILPPFEGFEKTETYSTTLVPLADPAVPMTATLRGRGAAIGIVFDASALRGVQAVAAGQMAIGHFLDQTGQQADIDPERVSLFIPGDDPEQPTQVIDFTNDINSIRNYFIQEPAFSRAGSTNLYNTVLTAVRATDAYARQNPGRKGVVLVVSHGANQMAEGSVLTDITNLANERGITIITFGIGSDDDLERIGFQLRRIADATGGAYYERPNENLDMVRLAYTSHVTVTGAGIYRLRYRTALFQDDTRHTLVLRVRLPNGEQVESRTIPIDLGSDAPNGWPLLRTVMIENYFVFAVPIMLLAPGIVVGITLIARALFGSQSGDGLTNKKTN